MVQKVQGLAYLGSSRISTNLDWRWGVGEDNWEIGANGPLEAINGSNTNLRTLYTYLGCDYCERSAFAALAKHKTAPTHVTLWQSAQRWTTKYSANRWLEASEGLNMNLPTL